MQPRVPRNSPGSSRQVRNCNRVHQPDQHPPLKNGWHVASLTGLARFTWLKRQLPKPLRDFAAVCLGRPKRTSTPRENEECVPTGTGLSRPCRHNTQYLQFPGARKNVVSLPREPPMTLNALSDTGSDIKISPVAATSWGCTSKHTNSATKFDNYSDIEGPE